jgi:hypothetical protein
MLTIFYQNIFFPHIFFYFLSLYQRKIESILNFLYLSKYFKNPPNINLYLRNLKYNFLPKIFYILKKKFILLLNYI